MSDLSAYQKQPVPPAKACDPVADAFADLRDALNQAALAEGADFDRVYGFRRRVIDLADRWGAGKPAHTPRGAKAEG